MKFREIRKKLLILAVAVSVAASPASTIRAFADTTDEGYSSSDDNYDSDTDVYYDDDDEDEDERQIGDIISDSNANYEITSLGSTPEVEFDEFAADGKKSYTIPSSVKIDGYTYTVTSIGEEAFVRATSIRTLEISAKIRKIGKKAFYNCKSLKTIRVRSSVIKSMGRNAFSGIKKTTKVYVPRKCYKSYKKMLQKAGLSRRAKLYKI